MPDGNPPTASRPGSSGQAAASMPLPSTERGSNITEPSGAAVVDLPHSDIHSRVIPSSLSPPPSSQLPKDAANNPRSSTSPSALTPLAHPPTATAPIALPVSSLAEQPAMAKPIFSPPLTTINTADRAGSLASTSSPSSTIPAHIQASSVAPYVPPTAEQVASAPNDAVRAMLGTCLAENARLKMENAHHKLQYNLLSLQADEEAKRAAVEYDMMRREVQALRQAEDARLDRRDLAHAAESSHARYLQLKLTHDTTLDDNDALRRRLKLAKRLIQQKDEELVALSDERNMLLNRIRENREHFHMLCSPGGAFHGALLTPKTPPQQHLSGPDTEPLIMPQSNASTPAQPSAAAHHHHHRRHHHSHSVSYSHTHSLGTPRQQTPRSSAASVPHQHHHHQAPRDPRHDNDTTQAGFAALLQALSHDNNSAPSSPTSAKRPAPRMPPKHTRGVQSLSSLPTTPNTRPSGRHTALLPSVDLVPQTEPPQARQSHQHQYQHLHQQQRAPHGMPSSTHGHRKSRESTISAEDNEVLARAALESVAAAAATQPYSAVPHDVSSSHTQRSSQGNDAEVHESQASHAASEMLRRDPRQSFEVAGSRDASPGPADKSSRLQSRLFAGVNKAGVSSDRKRKVGHDANAPQETQSDVPEPGSPTKKGKHGNGGTVEMRNRVGLGIQYDQQN